MRLQSASWGYPAQSPSVGNFDGAWNTLSQADMFGIRRLLRDLVFGDQQCHKLRDLLCETGSMGVSRLSNEQVIDAVAEMVAARRLLVLEKARRADWSVTRQVMRAAMVQHGLSEPASTPAQLRQQPWLTCHLPKSRHLLSKKALWPALIRMLKRRCSRLQRSMACPSVRFAKRRSRPRRLRLMPN